MFRSREQSHTCCLTTPVLDTGWLVEDDDHLIERMASGMSDNTGCIAAGGSP